MISKTLIAIVLIAPFIATEAGAHYPATGTGGATSYAPNPCAPVRSPGDAAPTNAAPASGPNTPRAEPRAPSVKGPATGTTSTTVSTSIGTRTQIATSAGGTGAAEGGFDPTSWEAWWLINQDRYLDLKTHVAVLEVSTGGDSVWLGADRGARGNDATSQHVVPALLALLEKERQQDIVTSVSIALASIADGPVATRATEFSRAFAAFVNDPNQKIEETSVIARGVVGDESAALELTALLADAPSAQKSLGGHAVPTRTRAFAAYALGMLAGQSQNEDVRRFIVHHLANTLHGEVGATPDVHVACVLALGLAPLAWTAKLGADLDAPSTIAAARRVSTVATASRETQIETLLALLADTRGDRYVRAHVPNALAKLSEGASTAAFSEIIGALLGALAPTSQESAEVVQGCTLALGKIGGVDDDELNRKVRATLQRVVLGGERQARSFALIALAQRGARTQSTEAAAETRAFLGHRLTDGKSHERAWSALALGILERGRSGTGEANSVSVRAVMLSTLKNSGSPDEISALAIGCGLAGDANAAPLMLGKLARTSDVRTAGHIAVGLGLLGDARAINALRDVLAESRFRPELLRSAAIGLALLEDRSLVPTLVDTLARAQSLASQSAAASVLGWIGDRRAIDPLLALMSNRNATATARGFAASALGRVCDKDRLPWDTALTEDLHYRAATATLIAGDGTGLLEMQ